MDHAGLYWLFVATEHLSINRTPYGRVLCSVCKTCRRRWSAGFSLHLSEMDRSAEEWTEDGNLSLLRWFYDDRGEMIPESLPTVAARHGRIDVLEWLLTMDVHPNGEACAEAARHGRLDALVWLREHDTPWGSGTTREAELSGHVDVLDYAIKNGCTWHCPEYYQLRPPAWSVFTYALENGYLVRHFACPWAARLNRFEDLKELVRQGYPLSAETFAAAATAGTEEMMLWLRDVGCPMNIMVYDGLVRRKDFVFLKKMVHVLGCEAHPMLLAIAATIGDQEIFRWIKERIGPPRCPAIANAVARTGDLRMLKSVVAMGCPVDDDVCKHACKSGRLQILQWLAKKGYPLQPGMVAAAGCGDVDVMRWLRDQGCQWTPDASVAAAQNGRFAALEWMVEHGCPCYHRTIPFVLRHAGFDLFSRLLKKATLLVDFEDSPGYRFRDGEFVPVGLVDPAEWTVASSSVKESIGRAAFEIVGSRGSIRLAKALLDLGLRPADITASSLSGFRVWRVVRWLYRNGHYADSGRIASRVRFCPTDIRWLRRYCPDLLPESPPGADRHPTRRAS